MINESGRNRGDVRLMVHNTERKRMTTLFAGQNGWGNSSHLQSLVAPGASQLAAIASLTGPFRNSLDLTSAQSGNVQSFETLALHHITQDTCQNLKAIVTTVMESANAGIFRIAPLQRADSDNFWHTAYEFHRQFAGETPAGAPPNYLEASMTRRQTGMTRHALGLRTTAQEQRAGIGQFFFRGKLRMLIVSFIEMIELKFFQALLTSPSIYARAHYLKNQYGTDLAKLGRIHDEQWDIMSRKGNAFFILAEWAVAEFASRKLRPTHVMVRTGMRSKIAAAKERLNYYIYGPGASTNAELRGESIGTELAKIQIVTISGYDYTSSNAIVIDPLDRYAAVGSHARMGLWTDACDMSKFCSALCDVEITSVNDNGWKRIKGPEALRACGRFTADGKLHPFHKHMAANIAQLVSGNARAVPVLGTQYDMFLYTTTDAATQKAVTNVTAVLGNMERWAWPDQHVNATTSALEHLVKRTLDGDEKNIAVGLNDIDELYDLDWTADLRDLALAAVAASPNEPRVPELALSPLRAANSVRPAGFGSAAGYLAIARSAGRTDVPALDQALVQRAVAFRTALRRLHALMCAVFDRRTHPALIAALAPSFARRGGVGESVEADNSLINFAQNIVDQNKLPLARILAAGEAAAGNTPQLVTFAGGSTPAVYRTPITEALFGERDRRNAFAERFAASTFGQQYRKFKGAAQPGEPLLFELYLREALVNPAPDGAAFAVVSPEAVRAATALAYAANNYVENGQRLRKLGSDELNALKAEAVPVAEQPAVLGGAQRIVRTWLVAPFAKLQDASVAGTFGLVSPYEPNRVLSVANFAEQQRLLDTSGRNSEVERLTVFSAASPSAGVRDARESVGLASDGVSGRGPLPSFAHNEFFEIVGTRLVPSTQLSERFAAFAAKSWLTRICGQMLLLAPVVEQTYQRLYENDIPMPIEFLLEQFNQRYLMTSLVFFAHNPANPAFSTWFYDPDMHVGRDMILKNLSYHMSMYQAATCNDPQRHIEFRDISTVGYLGGHSARFFDQDTWVVDELHLLDYDGPSVLCFAEPPGSLFHAPENVSVPLKHDLRGFTVAIGRGAQADQKPHHPSALFYFHKLSMHLLRAPITDRHWFDFYTTNRLINTTTGQMQQRMCNPNTRLFTEMSRSSDVWQHDVGFGVLPRREKLTADMVPEPGPEALHSFS